MKTNGSERSEEILREIASTRSDMDHTMTEIEGRFTPGQLLDQGLDYVRNSGANEYVQNLGTSVKQNPIPMALVGIGLAWLMANGRSHSSATNLRDASAGSKLSEAKDGLASGAQGVKERAGQARESISGAMRSAADRVSRTKEGALHQVDRAREGFDWMLREQPLALGAIGVAIGAMIAAAAPRTRTEDEVMGEKRDDLMERAKEAGKEQAEKVKHVASQAVSAAREEAERQGMAPSGAASEPPELSEPFLQPSRPPVGAPHTPSPAGAMYSVGQQPRAGGA